MATKAMEELMEVARDKALTVSEQMVAVLRCETPSELVGVFEPLLIRDALADLAVKNIMVETGLEEYSALEKLGAELLKQSAGIIEDKTDV